MGFIVLILQNQIIIKFLELFQKHELSIFIPETLVTKINIYLKNKNFLINRGIGLGIIEKIFLFFLIIKNNRKIIKIKYGKIFLNMWLLLFFLYLYTNDVRIIQERFSLLIVCSYWIIYPIILKIYKNKMKLLLLIILSYSSLKIYKSFNINKIDYPLIKYENILFNFKSFEEKKKIWLEVIKKYE